MMSTAFSRTFHALAADTPTRSAIRILVATAFVAAWLLWMRGATIGLYATSESARVEAGQSPAAVQSEFAGRVLGSRLAIGRVVRTGDTLVELDAESQRLALAQATATLTGLVPRRAALRDQIVAERNGRDRERDATVTQQAEARTTVQRADAAAQYASSEADRLNALRARRLATVSDSQRLATAARQARGDLESAQLDVVRLGREQATREADRAAKIAELEAQLHDLDAQAAVATVDVARLRHEVDRRTILAPVNGRVADAEVLATGSVVSSGERLGTIVPSGQLRVIAQFSPVVAGRIRTGQAARVRLDGFSWTQYGSITARVAEVASEPRDSTLRVELDVLGAGPRGVPLQHGLPGTVEVSTERLSPAQLVLRELGGLLTHSSNAAASAQ
jgi:multidrug resistance efflux pump